jgi:hypothetical protein
MSFLNRCKNISDLKDESHKRITTKLNEISDKNYILLNEKINIINNRLEELEKNKIITIDTPQPVINLEEIQLQLKTYDDKINENNDYIQNIINGIIDEVNILSNKIPEENEKEDIINSSRDYTNVKINDMLNILNRLEEKINKIETPEIKTIKLNKIKK